MLFNRDDIDANILLILDKLEEEDRLEVEDYILNLAQELDDVQSDLNSTEEDLRDMEEELDEIEDVEEEYDDYSDL